jgi:hypothetical protein
VENSTNLDYLHFIRRWGAEWNVTSESYSNGYGRVEFVYENLDQDVAWLDGSNNILFEWYWNHNDTTVEATFDMQVTVSEVEVARVPNYGWTSGCPLSGEMLVDVDEAYWYDDGMVSDMRVYSWDVAVAFENGVADISVTRGNTVWNYSYHICNPVGVN